MVHLKRRASPGEGIEMPRRGACADGACLINNLLPHFPQQGPTGHHELLARFHRIPATPYLSTGQPTPFYTPETNHLPDFPAFSNRALRIRDRADADKSCKSAPAAALPPPSC